MRINIAKHIATAQESSLARPDPENKLTIIASYILLHFVTLRQRPAYAQPPRPPPDSLIEPMPPVYRGPSRMQALNCFELLRIRMGY